MKQGWTISTIGSVAKVFNGNSINAEEKKAKYEGLEEGYPFIATKDVGVNGKVDYDNGVKIPFDTDFKIAMPDAVFVCAEGGSAGKKVAHIDRKVCFGNKLFALQPIKEKVKGGFLYYAVQEAGFKAQFRLSMAGIIGGVSAKKFNSITIPIPPLSEQQRIVALLDAEFAKIDALKANAEKNLQNAKDLFQAALKKELEPKEGWKTMTIQEICTHIVDCPHTTPIKSPIKTDYPCIRTSELKNGEISWETMQYVEKSEYLKRVSRLIPQENDIVYGREGTFGDAILIPNYYHFCLGQRTMLFRPNQELVKPRFLLLYVISPYVYDQAKAKNTGCGVGHVNVRDIKEFSIILPQINDQQSIVARLDVLNEKCKTLQANYEKTLSLCDDLKQALLRKAFNGEI